jgi:hypothetical protein
VRIVDGRVHVNRHGAADTCALYTYHLVEATMEHSIGDDVRIMVRERPPILSPLFERPSNSVNKDHYVVGLTVFQRLLGLPVHRRGPYGRFMATLKSDSGFAVS